MIYVVFVIRSGRNCNSCDSQRVPRAPIPSKRRYLLLQLFFNIVLLNGDLTISLESFVELISNVSFHAVFCTNITDAADMGPGSGTVHFRTKCEQKIQKPEVTLEAFLTR